jgi:outer membrane protein assembly factor BamB
MMIVSVSVTITQNLGPLSMNASGTGGLADSPWPMFRGNLNHTGLSSYDTSTNTGQLKWSFTTSKGVDSSPTIGVDGMIYVGSNDHKLYSINLDGSQKWNFSTSYEVRSVPSISSDGTIYVGSGDKKLYAINPDGIQKWNFTTDSGVQSSPTISSDGTIYIGSNDYKLYAINPDGIQKWNFTTDSGIQSSPAIGSDGTIYIGSDDDKLYAINPNGTQKWNFTTGSDVDSLPVIGFDGTIYIGSVDTKLYAINPNGTEKWHFTTGAIVYSSAAISFDGTIYVGSNDNKLYAINPDGTQKWNFTTGDRVYSSPAIGSDGTIYVGSYDNKLYAINPDGTEKWNFTTGDIVRSSPAIGSDGTIYVGSYDNKLYAIGKAATPPTLYINVSQDGEDAILYWDPPSNSGIDHYLIYRSTSQTDFDFNTVWVNTSKDYESGELGPIPLRTIWNDTNAALPSNETNYEEQYYYTIRAVDVLGGISGTSRTVGKWTKSFSQGVSTFSLPLEPLETMNTTIDHYLNDMNARYIKWMNPINHIWMKYGEGGVNDTQLKVGKAYEISFDSPTNYTFTGMPSAMIKYDDDSGFSGFDSTSEAKNLTIIVDPLTGNVTLNWTQPSTMGVNDRYYVLRSTVRNGFWKGNYLKITTLNFDVLSYNDIGNATVGTQYYYIIVPVNETGVEGASTYSIGVWSEEYLSGYDTFGIPLKLSNYQMADWYCDNIPDTVGINYYIYSQQRWGWHSTRMPKGAFDPRLEMTEGYQISTSSATKFTFIGR